LNNAYNQKVHLLQELQLQDRAQARLDILAAKYEALQSVCDTVFAISQGMVRLAQNLDCPSQPLQALDIADRDFILFIALSIYEKALFEPRFVVNAKNAVDRIRAWCKSGVPGLTASAMRSNRRKWAAIA
jgi:hypothetical protein